MLHNVHTYIHLPHVFTFMPEEMLISSGAPVLRKRSYMPRIRRIAGHASFCNTSTLRDKTRHTSGYLCYRYTERDLYRERPYI